MMRKRLTLLVLGLVLGLVCQTIAELGGTTVSATATSQTIPLGAVSSITILNGGANEIYFRLFDGSEPPASASTTTGRYLANGASLTITGRVYGAISIVCDTGETATVYLYYQ